MKRTIFIMSFSIVIITLIILTFHSYLTRGNFRCDTQVKSRIAIEGQDELHLNLHIDIVFTTPEKGAMKLIGTLKGSNHDYKISRSLSLKVNESKLSSMNRVTIVKQTIHPIDNVPEEFWQRYITPEKNGVEFYVEIKETKKNTFIFKGLSNPYFLCNRYGD